jgi:hypothetical protein
MGPVTASAELRPSAAQASDEPCQKGQEVAWPPWRDRGCQNHARGRRNVCPFHRAGIRALETPEGSPAHRQAALARPHHGSTISVFPQGLFAARPYGRCVENDGWFWTWSRGRDEPFRVRRRLGTWIPGAGKTDASVFPAFRPDRPAPVQVGLIGRRPFGLAVAHEVLTVTQDFMGAKAYPVHLRCHCRGRMALLCWGGEGRQETQKTRGRRSGHGRSAGAVSAEAARGVSQ